METIKIFWVRLKGGKKWHPAYQTPNGVLVVGNGRNRYTDKNVAETKERYEEVL